MSSKTIAVMPAYNAARTLARTVADIPRDCVDEVIVVDDQSTDATAEIARGLDVRLVVHERNTGYGGNQKTCYRTALEADADIIVMVHGDYQYDARVIPACVKVLELGICDLLLGNRIRTRGEALASGMPRSKYLANRGLTFIENMLSGQNLGEWHSGFRAFRRELLERIPFERNSDDFVFDTQFLVQAVHFGFRLGDVPVPVRYFDEASSIDLADSTRYALQTLGTFGRWYGHKAGFARQDIFSERDA